MYNIGKIRIFSITPIQILTPRIMGSNNMIQVDPRSAMGSFVTNLNPIIGITRTKMTNLILSKIGSRTSGILIHKVRIPNTTRYRIIVDRNRSMINRSRGRSACSIIFNIIAPVAVIAIESGR